jgi:RecJ-like exonuclease
MTDRISCPECDGTGETLVGPVRVACRFCHGRGYVGDDNEPAERGAAEIVSDRPLPPWWQEPGMDAYPDCAMCFGAGRVVNLGGNLTGGVPTVMVEAPCPACAPAC